MAESKDTPADVEDGSEQETSEDEAEALRKAHLHKAKEENSAPDADNFSRALKLPNDFFLVYSHDIFSSEFVC